MTSSTTAVFDDLSIPFHSPPPTSAPLSEITLTPLIVAGDPSPAVPSAADSPDLRIDPNVPTSPFAGVGSLEIVAPGIGNFLCSGTAISPYHILTAAHCLDVDNEDGIIDVLPENVTFNVNAQGESAEPLAITAADLHIFDNGRDRYEGFSASVHNDLAIITLSEALPADIPIYALVQEPLAPGDIITLVGYGTTGNGIDGHISNTADKQVKRSGQNQVDDASLYASLVRKTDEVFMFDFDGPDASTNSLASVGSGLTLGNQIETTVGPGDSGGPSFIPVDDQWAIAGVNTFSFSFPNLESLDTEVIEGTFGTGGGGVLVDNPEKQAWIESILNPGSVATGRLSGSLWHDLDGDGDRAATEAALANWTVYLDLNDNGTLDTTDPRTTTDAAGAYEFSDLAPGTYTVAAVIPEGGQQTTPKVGTFSPLKADFSHHAAPALDDFVINNDTDGAVAGLWHLTSARADQPGHSGPHSLYFGQRETATGGGTYNVGHTAGEVTSPDISLIGLNSAELTFNYWLDVEPGNLGDFPEVRISVEEDPFQTIGAKGEELILHSRKAEAWSQAVISLDKFVGNRVRIQFSFDTQDSSLNNFEGWFIDDVVVQGESRDRYTVTLSAGETVTGLDFGQQPRFDPPNNPIPATPQATAFMGLFDYAQSIRYAGGAIATIPTEAIAGLPLAHLFDEAFYRWANPDVAAAVDSGRLASGYQHFMAAGRWEGRNPSPLYSETFYLANNPDVAAAVTTGSYRSGLEHFLTVGHAEGRDPNPQFSQGDYLTRNPDVAAAVTAGALPSAFAHYILAGADEEGRLPPAAVPTMAALFNEAFYLRTNSDVAQAVSQGGFRDGFDHFIQSGQLENRNPSESIDLGGYVSANPDVAAAIANGGFVSGFDHYAQYGRFETRSFG
jgi:hypothetical protein